MSHYQGNIDWSRVADDGISFAYIKATEGAHWNDRRFDENWAAAGEARIDRGAYHFFTLCANGARQAAHFVEALPADAELPPAIDLELAGNCSARPTLRGFRDEVSAFLNVLSASGIDPVLYVRNDLAERYTMPSGAPDDRWCFRFVFRPSDPACVLWQVQGSANVNGIEGGVDLDVGFPALFRRTGIGPS